MKPTGEYAREFQEWSAKLPQDVEGTLKLIASEEMAAAGRRILVGAVSYLLTQFDLIPDHEQTGTVDDVFVVRVAYSLAAEYAPGLTTEDAAHVAKMTNHDEKIRAFLGDALYAKIRRYVLEQAEKNVRGRTADMIISDPKAARDFDREVRDKIKRWQAPKVSTSDAEAKEFELSVYNYLQIKLGGAS